MKKIIYLLALSLIVFTGCKKEEVAPPVEGDSFETLTTYLVSNDLDIPDVINGWIVAPPASEDASTFIGTYDILDIRSAEHFAEGHIEGATNTTLGNILSAAQSASKPILVVCYTGQSASHAVVALKLSGHTSAKVLKWGMSGWNSNFSGPWAGAIGNSADDHSGNWIAAPGSITTTGSFDSPSFTTNATDGAGILKEQVDKMLSGGFKGITNNDVLSNPANYFTNNYWSNDDVSHYGHITGAYRLNPLTLENNEIKGLDPTKTIVTYCWTGQTSSMVTAYLNVIGYNAVSLKFGTNGMIYDSLESHKFVTPTTDLPVVTE
ncbi:MAG: rhodanese-like domain-containing protein [Bacteroidota bacterium]